MNPEPDLVRFQQLYSRFDHRANAVIDLLNALSGNTQARSVSLHPLFGRQYSELYKAIHEFTLPETVRWRLMALFLSGPQGRSFCRLSVDVVPHPRPYAETLAERTFVYHPQLVRSQKPVTIGHACSTLLLLPEQEPGSCAWWWTPATASGAF